jgi:hypothetical protein
MAIQSVENQCAAGFRITRGAGVADPAGPDQLTIDPSAKLCVAEKVSSPPAFGLTAIIPSSTNRSGASCPVQRAPVIAPEESSSGSIVQQALS